MITISCQTNVIIACVASVPLEQIEERFWAFCLSEKWGESKNKKEGVGEGKEGNALDFENPRSPANRARDWLV